MKRILLLFAVLFFGSQFELHATHAAGGDIQYRYIGDSTNIPRHYEVLVRLYRDASPGTATMPTSIPISVCSSCYSTQTITAPLIAGGPGQISPTLFDCVVPGSAGTIPIEYYVYRGYVILPGNCGNFTFAYTLCCRNNAIQNLVNPGSIYFHISAKLNNMFGQNSSPRFVSEPVRAFCVNKLFNWSQNVVETNGDSIIFKMAHSKNGTTGCAFNLSNYVSPYTFLQPINTSPPGSLSMNPKTGTITFMAATQQIVVVAVEVEEYRLDTIYNQWVLVGSSNRDMQIGIAQNCSPLAQMGVILDYNAPGYYPDPVNGLPTVDQQCYDSTVVLKFAVKLDCTTISPDGTDFRLTGPDQQPIPIKKLVAVCDVNNESQQILVKLHKPLAFNGKYFLYSKIGNDGNTLLNKCGFPMDEFDTIQINVTGCYDTEMDIKNVTIVEDEHPKIVWLLDTIGTALNPYPTYLVDQYKIWRKDPGAANYTVIYTINDYKTMTFDDKSLSATDVDAESYKYKVEVVVNGSSAVTTRDIHSILLESKQSPILYGDSIDLFWNAYNGWPGAEYTVHLGQKDQNGVWVDVPHVPLPVSGQANPTYDTTYFMYNPELPQGDYRVCVLANYPGGFGPYQAWSNCLPFTIFNPPPPPPKEPETPEVPNVFSPNDDGSNDLFLIKNAETWSTTRMVKIFNRWGNVVYETDNYDNAKAWDGTDKNGKKVADGVYFYTLDFFDQPTGKRFTKNGEITIFGSN